MMLPTDVDGFLENNAFSEHENEWYHIISNTWQLICTALQLEQFIGLTVDTAFPKGSLGWCQYSLIP